MFSKHSLYLALIALGYSLGIGLVFYGNFAAALNGYSVLILLALLLSLLFFTRKEPTAFWVFCFILTVVLGAQRMKMEPSMGKQVLAETTEKQLLLVRLSKKIKSATTQLRYEAKVLGRSFKNDSSNLIVQKINTEKILLSVRKDSAKSAYEVGNKIWIEGYLSRPSLTAIPGQFNYRDYLKTQGIHFQLYTTKSYKIKADETLSFLESMVRFREILLEKIHKSSLSKSSFQLYSALIFGHKNELDPELLSAFQDAGAVHILAISGLHIGLLAGLLYSIFFPLHFFKMGRPLSGFLLIVCLWAYAAFTGFSPSVLRAVSMFSFLGLSLLLNRPQYGLHLLLVAYIANLIWDPLALLSLGFAMSYLAVFFILLGMPIFKEFWNPKNELVKKIWQLLAVSVCAQIGVLGLSLHAFNQFPLLFLVTNLLIIPFLGLVLSAGILLAFWFVWASPPNILVDSYDSLLQSLNELVNWVGSQEGFVIKEIYFPKLYLLGTIAVAGGLLAWCYPYYKGEKSWKYFMMGLIFLQICLGVQQVVNNNKNEHYIIKQNGQVALIGVGNNRLDYWSTAPLKPQTLAQMKRVYPFKKTFKNNLEAAFTFNGEILVVSPKGPNKTKSIAWLIIDPNTTAYPNHFKDTQLAQTHFIFSGYSQTKQMHIWEGWVKKNERPAWWLDAQGYYTFNLTSERSP